MIHAICTDKRAPRAKIKKLIQRSVSQCFVSMNCIMTRGVWIDKIGAVDGRKQKKTIA